MTRRHEDRRGQSGATSEPIARESSLETSRRELQDKLRVQRQQQQQLEKTGPGTKNQLDVPQMQDRKERPCRAVFMSLGIEGWGLVTLAE